MKHFSGTIMSAANSCIPKTKGGKMIRLVLCWCNEVKRALEDKKIALQRCYRIHLIQYEINFKRVRAVARYTIRMAKKHS